MTLNATNTPALTAFRYFDGFNLFIYSRSADNKTHFLLRKKHKSADYSHFHDDFNNNEPSLILALAKKFMRRTSGLFCSDNFKYFTKEDSILIDSGNVVLENCPKSSRPPKTMTPAFNDIIKLVCESPFFFQDNSNTATYFVEIPMMDLEKVEEFAESRAIKHRFKYFTMDEILTPRNEDINRKLKETLHENHELLSYVEKYIINNEPIETQEVYGLVCCEMFIKTYMLHALHFSFFKKHGEVWRFYKAYEKDLPTDEELKNMKGLVIPGSSFSVYNVNVDWYQGLFQLIRKVHDQFSNINLLGICFGAQVIAQALGGKVEKMPRDFIDGGEILKVKPEFYELPYVKSSKLDAVKQLVVAQAHSDHVIELPVTAKLYASSDNTNIEIFTVNNNILAIQGHPDYNEVMLIISNYKKNNLNLRNYAKYEQEYKKAKFPNALTQEDMLKVCFNFLKQKL